MGKWADGKVLSKKSWGLLRENKYFVKFPLIGFALALIPIVTLGGLAAFFAVEDMTVAAIVVAIIGLVLANLAYTLSTAALVAAVDQEFSGTDSSVGYGYGKAFAKLGPLVVWSLVQAVVSALLSLLRGNDGAAGVAGNVLSAIGAAAWSIVTFFVIPFIIVHNEGAIPALKKSVVMVREKWGTQVTGGIRIGLGLLIVVLPAIAFVAFGIFLAANDSATVAIGVALIVLGVALFMIAALLSSALRAIFSVALFHFVSGKGNIAPFTEQELQGVLTKK